MERFTTKEKMLRHLWNMMYQATVRKNDPMRTPVLGTHALQGVEQRTIVLRACDTVAGHLLFFTDVRSGKVGQVRKAPEVSTLFWHPRKQVQIRCRGRMQIHHADDVCRSFWRKLNAVGRRSYASSLSPGTPVDRYTTGLPEDWSDDWPEEKTDFAFRHFAVLRQVVTEIDGLHLEEEGHQRAFFRRTEKGWEHTWLIP